MNSAKLNVYKKALREVCKNFAGAEEFIRDKIEKICSNGKLSEEEVTYLLTNNQGIFKKVRSLKILKF